MPTWIRWPLSLLALAWVFAWYAPAWLVAQAWTALRRGWSDGSNPEK